MQEGFFFYYKSWDTVTPFNTYIIDLQSQICHPSIEFTESCVLNHEAFT